MNFIMRIVFHMNFQNYNTILQVLFSDCWSEFFRVRFDLDCFLCSLCSGGRMRWRPWTRFFIRDTHNAILESTEIFTLYWISEILWQHVISWKVFKFKLLAVDIVLNVEVYGIYIISTSGTWFTPILLQQDWTLFVLVEYELINFESLFWQEIPSPHHLWVCIIYSDNLPLVESSGSNILFIWRAGNRSSSNGHSGAGVNLEIIVDTIWCIVPPINNI